MTKPRKCVVLLSTLHHKDGISSETEKFKPEIIKYYNSTKSGVDILDKLAREYSCRRCTRRWPLSLFMHYIDIAAYNALVIWQTNNPTWEATSRIKVRRKLFLEQQNLTHKNIDRRASEFENNESGLHKPLISAIEATGRKIVKKPKLEIRNRARCCLCVRSNNKYPTLCSQCNRHVCKNHFQETRTIICEACNVNI